MYFQWTENYWLVGLKNRDNNCLNVKIFALLHAIKPSHETINEPKLMSQIELLFQKYWFSSVSTTVNICINYKQ